ncbi:hypothetical protein EXN13_18110 [Clostridium botulinum]|nr:hypothetical protein [Clostridium botulinum]
MNIDISSLQQQINSLSNRINYIDETIKFNISTFLTTLAIALALAGGAAVIIAKHLFNKKFEEEFKKIDEKIKLFVLENPQMLWLKGTGTLIWSREEDIDNIQSAIVFYVNGNISKELILFSEFDLIIGKEKIAINEYKIETNGNEVKVQFKHPDNIVSFNKIGFFIIWQNPLYNN